IAWLSLIFPIGWLAFTLIRGAIAHWYPYPFIDVTQLGYGRAAVNCIWVALLTLGLAASAAVLGPRSFVEAASRLPRSARVLSRLGRLAPHERNGDGPPAGISPGCPGRSGALVFATSRSPSHRPAFAERRSGAIASIATATDTED
ncbi:MAG: Pr6Pr family membrane protein, partial [Solirubrobacteraceae bacterium]